MERQVIDCLLEQYRARKYRSGLVGFFDSNDTVIGFRTKFSTVAAFSTDSGEDDIMLLSYVWNGQVFAAKTSAKRTFFIPEPKDVILYRDVSELDEIVISCFPAIFQVVSYGLLDVEKAKGIKMSRFATNILVANTAGQLFETIFLTGDNIVAGMPVKISNEEFYYPGQIRFGYSFSTLGKLVDDNIILD